MRIEDNRFKSLKTFHEINVGDLFDYEDCTYLKISETEAFCFEALAVNYTEFLTMVKPLNAKIVIE